MTASQKPNRTAAMMPSKGALTIAMIALFSVAMTQKGSYREEMVLAKHGDQLLATTEVRSVGPVSLDNDNDVQYRIMLFTPCRLTLPERSEESLRGWHILAIDIKLAINMKGENGFEVSKQASFQYSEYAIDSSRSKSAMIHSVTGEWSLQEVSQWLDAVWGSEIYSLPARKNTIRDDGLVISRFGRWPYVIMERTTIEGYVCIERSITREHIHYSSILKVLHILDQLLPEAVISRALQSDRNIIISERPLRDTHEENDKGRGVNNGDEITKD